MPCDVSLRLKRDSVPASRCCASRQTAQSPRRRSRQASPGRPSTLHALAYRVPEQRLVHAIVPFWFLKIKGRAVQYALRDTGVDLKRLGVTPGDLEQYGAGVVLDEARANGDRLLVWTE